MEYSAKRILGPIIYETSNEYKFSTTEINSLKACLNPSIQTAGAIYSKNMHILEKPELVELKNYIQEALNQCAYEVWQIEETVKFYITESWVNCLMPGKQHPIHKHSNSVFSGVMFIEPEENGAPLVFGTDLNDVFRGFEFPYKQIDYGFVEQKSGRLTIFPSSTAHVVPENVLPTERWSLSFNTFFHGELGNSGINSMPTTGLILSPPASQETVTGA